MVRHGYRLSVQPELVCVVFRVSIVMGGSLGDKEKPQREKGSERTVLSGFDWFVHFVVNGDFRDFDEPVELRS
jgi:hypothetical protein